MKRVTITIRLEGKETLSIRLRGGMFRRTSVYINGDFKGFYSLTKIIDRIRKVIVGYFVNENERLTNVGRKQ